MTAFTRPSGHPRFFTQNTGRRCQQPHGVVTMPATLGEGRGAQPLAGGVGVSPTNPLRDGVGGVYKTLLSSVRWWIRAGTSGPPSADSIRNAHAPFQTASPPKQVRAHCHKGHRESRRRGGFQTRLPVTSQHERVHIAELRESKQPLHALDDVESQLQVLSDQPADAWIVAVDVGLRRAERVAGHLV